MYTFSASAVPSASACSSLGLCLNFMLPNCIVADVALYRAIFSSSVKPSTGKASCKYRRTCVGGRYRAMKFSFYRQTGREENQCDFVQCLSGCFPVKWEFGKIQLTTPIFTRLVFFPYISAHAHWHTDRQTYIHTDRHTNTDIISITTPGVYTICPLVAKILSGMFGEIN